MPHIGNISLRFVRTNPKDIYHNWKRWENWDQKWVCLTSRVEDEHMKRKKISEIPFEYHVFVCTCSSCSEKDAENVLLSLIRKVEEEGLIGKVHISRAGCVLKGQCRKHGPFVVIYPQNVWYHRVTTNDVDSIVEQHLKKGQIVSNLLFFTQKR